MRDLAGLRASLLAALLSAHLSGCDRPTSESIEEWKTTEKGPGKLAEALESPSLAPKLRGEAAAALVDIGKADEVDAIFAGLPAGDRWEILKTLVPAYVAAVKSATAEKARDARDALFSVRAFAPAEEARQIDAVLLPSIEADLRAGRLSGGRHSIEKMVVAMGTAAGPMLAKLLGEKIAGVAGVADLLARIGDPSARQAGAANLAALAAGERQVAEAEWRALGLLGTRPALEFLSHKLEQGSAPEAMAAARALQQARQPSLLPLALGMAANPRTEKALRQEMFGVVQTIGGAQARDGMARIIATDREEIVRYLAYETALEADKADAVQSALEAFPAGLAFKKDDVADFLVKDVEKLGPVAHPAALRALGSRSALARMTCVLALEKLGVAADVPAVSRLAGDGAAIKGFPAGDTVGKEALRVAAILKNRTLDPRRLGHGPE